MDNCSRCSLADVCDECDEGFYWWVVDGEYHTSAVCEAFVVCDSTHYSYWTEEG